MWLIILSDQLPIIALVSRYLTNKLMGRGHIKEQELTSIGPLSLGSPKTAKPYPVLARVSPGYPKLQGRLPTCYSPVRRSTRFPKETFALDLHVLSTPPAFVLSQDQTLQLIKPEIFDCVIDGNRLHSLLHRLLNRRSWPRPPTTAKRSQKSLVRFLCQTRQ